MFRRVLSAPLAALAAACALWGTPAGAAQMLATIVGDYNDNPVWFSWQVQIRYDSDLGVVDVGPGDVSTFSWSEALGTPSPVSSVSGVVVSRKTPPPFWNPEIDGPYVPAPDHHFNFTDADAVLFTRATTFDRFEASGPGWSLDLGDPFSGALHATDLRFDTSWSRHIEEYGQLDVGAVGGSFVHVHGTTSVVRLDAVPEPESWALMILGFGAVGVVLRRRRAALA